MKKLLVWLCLCGAMFCPATYAFDGFVWPVMTDQVTMPSINSVDPTTVPRENCGWSYNGNIFGAFCPDCSGHSTHPYHPGIDLNRQDGNDVDEPVYSIGDGTVIRVTDLPGLGRAVIILYELPFTVDFQNYALDGTVLRNNDRYSNQLSVMYLHLNETSVSLDQGDAISRGQYVGRIKDGAGLRHLHFECSIGNQSKTGWPGLNAAGYYAYRQDISTWGNIAVWEVIRDFLYPWPWAGNTPPQISQLPVVPGGFNDGWHATGSGSSVTRGNSDRIMICYYRNGGSSNMGLVPGPSGYVHTWDPHDFLVQNFDGGSWGSCAIVMRSGWDKAYSLHGAFWWHFWYYNQIHGLPISEEYHDSSGNAYQDFENGVSLKWDGVNPSEVSTASLRAQGIVYVDDETVSIALLPSDGVTLSILADALSSTQVRVTSSLIDNAVTYEVYEDGVLVGYLDSVHLELVLDDRSPGSTHTYEVVAYDQNGNELTSAISEPVILPQTPGIGTMPIFVSTGTMSAEVSQAGYPGAITYYVFLDDVLKAQVSTLFATIYSIDNGTHTVKVQAIGSGGVVLAEGQKTIVMGQNILVGMTGAPAQVGPNDSYVLSIWAENASQNPIALDQSYPSYASVSNSSFAPTITLSMNAVGSIAPGQRVTVGTIAVQTANEYPLSVSLNTAVSLRFSCNFNGYTSIGRVANCAVPVVPFNNDVPELATPILHVSETTDIPVTIGDENRSNAPVELSRIELWLDGELIASLLVPSRQPRETWRTTISLPPLPAGHYVLTLVADSGNEIDEVDENDNVKEVELIVGPDAQAALDAIAAVQAAAEELIRAVSQTWWSFDGTGTDPLLEDHGKTERTLVAPNGFTSIPGITGVPDTAVRLYRNQNQYLQGANDLWRPAGSWTLDFCLLGVNKTDPMYIVESFIDSTNRGFVLYRDVSTGFLRFYQAGGGWQEVIGHTNVFDGAWHHIVVSVDVAASRVNCYVDGELEMTDTVVSQNWQSGTPFEIGGRCVDGSQDSAYAFDGCIDNMQLEAYAKTGQEVADEYATIASQVVMFDMATNMVVGSTPPSGTPTTLLSVNPTHLVARWMLNGPDASTFLANAQGNATFNLVALNSPTMTVGVTGDENTAALLQRSLAQGFSFGDNTWKPTGAYSIVFWVNSTCTNGMYIFQSYAESGNNYNGICLYTDGGTGKLRWFHGYGGGAYTELFSNASVCDGQWHLCVLTFDGGVQKMYIDSQAPASRNAAVPVWSSHAYGRIGYYAPDGGDWGMHFDGGLDDIQLYDVALSADDVSTLYYGAGHP